MPFLTIYTLGGLHLELDGKPVAQRADFHRALLLIDLALHDGRRSRARLAELLWPYAEPQLGRTNLRSLLKRMNTEGLAHALIQERNEIRLDFDAGFALDTLVFRQFLEDARRAQRHADDPDRLVELLTAAVDLYGGEFLAGYSFPDHHALEEWVESERRALAVQAGAALHSLAHLHLQRGDCATGIPHAHRLLELDPYNDDAHTLYVRLLAGNDQTAVALRHLEEYRSRLPAEFGDDPPLETLETLGALAAELQSGAWSQRMTPPRSRPAQPATPSPSPPAPPTPVSHVASPLIGRTAEAALLLTLLEEGHRFISVVGLGGVGKTFFVRSQLPLLQSRVHHLHFVDLRTVDLREMAPRAALLRAMAAAMHLPPHEDETRLAQMVAALQKQSHCLVLDNFETVMDAAPLLQELVEAVTDLIVVVTCRQRLELRHEVRLHLVGLPVEEDGEPGDAVQFFARCARQVQPDFAVDGQTLPLLRAFCRRVEGLPLAIELAATHLDFFNLEELVEQVAVESEIFQDPDGTRPPDQRSLQVVMESMWRMLTPQEQQVLAQLSVFTGIWHRDAMLVVAPAPRPLYTRLINGSLLRTEEPGWFSLHPLVRDFAAAQLHGQADAGAVHQRYVHHFLGLLKLDDELLAPIRVAEQETFRMLQQRHADLVAAWQWAVAHREWPILADAVVGMGHYLEIAYLRDEGVELLGALPAAMPPEDARTPAEHRLAGETALLLGMLQSGRADDQESECWRVRGAAWLEQAGSPDEAAMALAYQGHRNIILGKELERNIQLVRRAAKLAADQDFPTVRLLTNNSELYYVTYLGRWDDFDRLDRQNYALLQRTVSPTAGAWFMPCYASMILDRWDEQARRVDAYDAHFRERPDYDTHRPWIVEFRSHALAQQGQLQAAVEMLEGILEFHLQEKAHVAPLTLAHLAGWQAQLGDQASALAIIDRARTLLAAGNFIGRLRGFTLARMGAVLLLAGDAAGAEPLLREALAMSRMLPHAQVELTALYHLATLHRAALPPDLYRQVAALAAVSPAMYHQDRPLIRARLEADGQTVDQSEAAQLRAVEIAGVQALSMAVLKQLQSRAGK